MAKHRFSEAEIKRASDLRASGMSWDNLGKHLGCDGETIRRQLDPEYREVRAQRYHSSNPAYRMQSERRISAAEAERAVARIQPDTRTRAARIMGDPMPGRSALDKKLASQAEVAN